MRFTLLAALALGSAAYAQSAASSVERPLAATVRGDLSAGPQAFILQANAGLITFGTFELQNIADGTSVSLAFHAADGKKLQEIVADYSAQWDVGFVAPRSGLYRIRIVPSGTGRGSFTLKTRQQAPRERTAGATVRPTVRFESARVTQLAKDVKAGKTRAVDQFWAEARARGGPLVEPMKDDDQTVLVTFLWRATYRTYNVLVEWPGPAPDDYFMSRVGGTDVWYKTVRIRRGSRFRYRIAPNHRPGDPPFTADVDPLNPRIARIDTAHSVLETPGAPDESWASRTPRVRGSVTQHKLDSALLKRARTVSVYTPPGYPSPSGRPLPLLILFDGDAYLSEGLGAPTTLDNLISEGRIRPAIVCFVSDARGVPPNQQSTYHDAMATELLPWLRVTYGVTLDPRDVVIGGYSAGGGMAGSIAFKYPNLFGNVLLQSGGGQVVPNLAIGEPRKSIRFYIDQGLYEFGPWPYLSPDERAIDGWYSDQIPTQGANWLLRGRYMRTVLVAKGYDVIYRETGGTHEFVHWRATLAEALMALLAPERN